MRHVEIENGQVRYVLPVKIAWVDWFKKQLK